MTTNRRVAEVVLAYDVDKASANAAAASSQQLSRELDFLAAQQTELGRAFGWGEMDATAFASKLGMVEQEARRTSAALDALSKPRDVDVRTQRFDDVSRDVGLAGDVQSNLGAIGGLSSAAGLGGVGQGIGVAGELVALVEELPRLKAAVQGMPATINAAGAALGGTGAGLVGALGIAAIAIAAVAVAAKRAAAQIAEASEDFGQVIDARVETEKLIAAGDTTTQQAQELAQARAAEAEAVRKVQAELQAAQSGLTGFQKLLNQIANLLPGISGVNDKIKELDSEADGLEAQADQLNQAIEGGRFATADRAEAEKAAAEKAKEAAMEAKQSQAAYQSQLDGLLSSETKTADSINFLKSALASGSLSAEERAAAESKLAKLTKQAADTTNEAADAIGNAAAAISRYSLDANNIEQDSFGFGGFTSLGGGGGGGASKSSPAATRPRKDAAADIQQQIADAERKAGQARVDAAIQYNRDIAKVELDNTRRLEDIRRQAARDEQDAARSRDFAAILNVRQRTGDQVADANLQAQRAAADRRTALDAQLADQARANERQLAQLRSKVQTEGQILQEGYNQALGAARGFVRGLRREFERGQRGQVGDAVRREMDRVVSGA